MKRTALAPTTNRPFKRFQSLAPAKPKPADGLLDLTDPNAIYDALTPDTPGGKTPVRLLKASWVRERAKQLRAAREAGDAEGVQALRLVRRQDMPEEAFISSSRLRSIEAGARRKLDLAGLERRQDAVTKGGGITALLAFLGGLFRTRRNVDNLLPIVAVSYCWLEANPRALTQTHTYWKNCQARMSVLNFQFEQTTYLPLRIYIHF